MAALILFMTDIRINNLFKHFFSRRSVHWDTFCDRICKDISFYGMDRVSFTRSFV